MKLKRLTVQGFKSFKDRTTIHFDHGITGIVGPNGCGKSNIVDALFWVMGEQSAKHLRGSSMQDLIFSGSSKYSPAHWAEVSLVLENDEGKHIHIGPKVSRPNEIQLTRKIYKNNETEYRINDVPCRLKDIQEVFMDTGAGAKSYSIIAQGEINRLVSAKPEERRVMIEEVAGITKFKKRRKESLKKIESTQGNLNRLNDLKQEIHKHLKSLEKQAEKAERARVLKEKVKKYELIVGAHKEYDLLRDLRDGQNFVREKKLEMEGLRTQKSGLEVGLSKERLDKEERQSAIEDKQLEYNDLSKKLVGLEEKINYLKISLQDKDQQGRGREKENVEIAQDLSDRSKRLTALETELASLQGGRKDDTQLEALEAKLAQAKLDLDGKNGAVESKRKLWEEKSGLLRELEQKQFRNSTLLTESSAKLQDLSKEIDSLEKNHGSFSSEALALKEELESIEAKLNSANTQIQQGRNDFIGQDNLIKQIETELKLADKSIAVLESKLISLRSLIPAGEALPGEELTKIGEAIVCDEVYAKGVQNLLRPLLDCILVEDESILGRAFEWANNQEGQSVRLSLPLGMAETSPETKSRLETYNVSGVVELADVLRFTDEKASAKFKPLLAGLFLCSDLDPGLVLPKELKLRGLATFDGQKVIHKDPASMQFVFESENMQALGPIEINNKVVELESELSAARLHKSQLEEKLLTAESLKQSLEQSLAQYRDESMRLKEELILKRAAYQSKQQHHDNTQAKLDILSSRKTEISRSRLTQIEESEKLAVELEKSAALVGELQISVEQDISVLAQLRSSYEQGRQAFLEEKLFQKNFDEKVAGINRQLSDNQGQVERLSQRLEQNRVALEKLKAERVQLEDDIAKGQEQARVMVELLQEKEAELSVLKEDLSELLSEMQVKEDQVKKITQNINKTEKVLIEYDIKLSQIPAEEEQLVRDIFEKHHVDLRKILGRFLEFTESDYFFLKDTASMYLMETVNGPTEIQAQPFEFVRRFGQELREAQDKLRLYRNELSRIGDVNWQAIEDYDRQKIRYDFLVAQEEELKNSLRDLEIAIQHIDEKSKSRFAEAYKEVSERFHKVFPIIFGGGSARLDIVGDLSDPECGVEIHAQPPGKKMQNINLMSGGEKAMTALSLIFSIFLVKPSPFCLLDEVDAPLDDANVGRFNDLLREMSSESQFVLITHNKKTMELNDMLYGITMQEPGISTAVSVQLH